MRIFPERVEKGPNIETVLLLCRGSCFFGYTAENSHHLKAKKYQKIRCFKSRKYQQESGQMSSKFGEIIQKLISVFGEKPATGLPKPPPTPLRPDSAAFTRGENAILGRGTRNQPAGFRREKREGGGK